MPLSVQSKLLRVLDNNTITRIGGTFERKLNIRIITATNRNLLNEVQQKNFRHDLFYRINVIKLTIPALRFRGEDILLCANFFLNRLNKSYDGKDKHFSALYKLGLKEHDWPGNLRELQNYVERSYILSEGLEIEIDSTSQLTKKESHLDRNNEEDTDNSNGNTLTVPVKTLAEMEKGLLLQALNETHGNVVKASRLINIGKSTFYRKLKEYQLDPSQYGK